MEQFVFLCFDHSVVHSLIEWFFSLCYFIRRSLKTEPARSYPHGAIVESSRARLPEPAYVFKSASVPLLSVAAAFPLSSLLTLF